MKINDIKKERKVRERDISL